MEHVHPAQGSPVLRQYNAPPPILFEALVFEILSWLPVKSLVRFKCECKSWESIISDPDFVKLHLERSSRNPNVILASKPFDNDKYIFVQPCSVRSLFENSESTFITEYLSHRLNTDKYYLEDTCNGLVCVGGSNVASGEEVLVIWFRFWNPATRLRSQKSPSLLLDSGYNMDVCGFGYDSLTDTYKVVVVLYDTVRMEDSLVKVYTMGDDCWRTIQSLAVVPAKICDGTYVSGTLNWLAVPKFNFCKQLVIVSLDLGMETSRELLLPSALDEVNLDEGPIVELFPRVLTDCLCLSYFYRGTHFVVWQMKEFGVQNSWTQLVSVSYQELGIDCNLRASVLFPLHMYDNGDVLITLTYCGEIQAIMYNRRDNRVERPKISNDIEWIYVMNYFQSLVSPRLN